MFILKLEMYLTLFFFFLFLTLMIYYIICLKYAKIIYIFIGQNNNHIIFVGFNFRLYTRFQFVYKFRRMQRIVRRNLYIRSLQICHKICQNTLFGAQNSNVFKINSVFNYKLKYISFFIFNFNDLLYHMFKVGKNYLYILSKKITNQTLLISFGVHLYDSSPPANLRGRKKLRENNYTSSYMKFVMKLKKIIRNVLGCARIWFDA